ncbi:hypothetical protein P8452_33266 [Trifolium repens]|nr:hypothetical protein P8452_33266 [Trifolium repens]
MSSYGESLTVTSTTLQILYLVPDLLEPKLPSQQNSHIVLILWRLKNLTLLHLPIFIFVELKRMINHQMKIRRRSTNLTPPLHFLTLRAVKSSQFA